MRRVISVSLVLCLVSLGLVLFAQSRPRLAVMEIDSNSRKLSKAMVKNATRYLRSRIEVAGTYVVIDKARQDKALTQQMQKESYGMCIDESCQIELGQALAADTILRSKITEFGGSCTLTATLVNLERRVATGGAEAEFNCTEKGLKEAIDKVVAGLTGRGGAKPSTTVAGTARLTGEPGELWAKCLQNDWNACDKLEDVDWVVNDSAVAVQVFRQSCDGGNAMGCCFLGYMHDIGEGVLKDQKEASKLYHQSCQKGNLWGCMKLGRQYDSGTGVAEDKRRATKLFRQACDGGVFQGCASLGWQYATGEGISKNFEKAAALFRQACDKGVMSGCYSLGFLYISGQGVQLDVTKGCRLYKQACDGGADYSCESYQELCK